MVKVWNLANCRLKKNHDDHTGYLNTVTVSPDGSLCASGGKVRINSLNISLEPWLISVNLGLQGHALGLERR